MMKRANTAITVTASMLVVAAMTGCTLDGSSGGASTMNTDGITRAGGFVTPSSRSTGATSADPEGRAMRQAAAPAATPAPAAKPAPAAPARPAATTMTTSSSGSSSMTTTTTTAAAPAAPAPAARPVMGSSAVVYYPTGHRENAALMVERMCPAEVTANAPFEYELKVTNVSPAALENVMLTETIPSNFSLTSSSPSATSTAGGAATFNLGGLAPGESKSVKVMGTAGREGRIASCATVSYTLPICCAINVVSPALKITKEMGDADKIHSLCDTIPVKLVVTNTGSGMARNVVVRDPLPAGLATADGKQTVEVNVGNLAGGESRAIDFMVKATQTGSFNNQAMAMADGNLKADSNAVSVKVVNCNLQITKRAASERLFSGRQASFTIVVSNTGDGVASNTVVSDPLPAGATFVSATEGGRLVGNAVEWNLGDLAPGASKTLSVAMNPGTATQLANTATARSACCPNVSANATVSYDGVPAIVVELFDEPDPLQEGEETTYTIKVRNQGNKADANLRTVFTLANGLQFVSGQGASAVTANGQTVTLGTIPVLAPKQEVIWTVRARCVAGNGDVRNNLSVTTDYFKAPIVEIESTNLIK